MSETALTHVYRHLLDYAAEDQILDEVLATAGLRLLDVGTGATARSAMKASARGAVVTSVEINQTAIAEAGRIAEHRGVGLVAGDVLRLPFGDGVFEVVQVALHGLDYVLEPTDRATALGELRRVLRPGGTLIFNAFNPIGMALSPSGFGSIPKLGARLRFVASGRVFRPTLIDVNGLELHQGTVRAITAETERAGFARRSVRNLSGSTTNPRLVGLLSTAPYYVFERR